MAVLIPGHTSQARAEDQYYSAEYSVLFEARLFRFSIIPQGPQLNSPKRVILEAHRIKVFKIPKSFEDPILAGLI